MAKNPGLLKGSVQITAQRVGAAAPKCGGSSQAKLAQLLENAKQVRKARLEEEQRWNRNAEALDRAAGIAVAPPIDLLRGAPKKFSEYLQDLFPPEQTELTNPALHDSTTPMDMTPIVQPLAGPVRGGLMRAGEAAAPGIRQVGVAISKRLGGTAAQDVEAGTGAGLRGAATSARGTPGDTGPRRITQPSREMTPSENRAYQSEIKAGENPSQAKGKNEFTAPTGKRARGLPNQPDPKEWTKKGGTYTANPDGSTSYTNKGGVTVHYNKDGYPDFKPFSKGEVGVKVTGHNDVDFPAADRDFARQNGWLKKDGTPNASAAARYRTQNKLTWHHLENVQDGQTMRLIPTEIHDEFKHSGGAELARRGEFVQ